MQALGVPPATAEPSGALLLCALDQGTTSTRAIMYEAATLRPVAVHQLEHRQIMPQAGWVEHDPMEIMERARACMDGALEKAKATCGAVSVLGLGITNQRETTVVWCKTTGRPLMNAIVWLDTRTSDICKRLARRLGGVNHFQRVTGLPIATYFSAYKLLWMLEHSPDVAEAVADGRAAFGTIDSWLVYNLTGGGVHITDVTNASRTGLMDLRTCTWHAPTAEALGIPMHVLPSIKSNAEVYGHVVGGSLAGVPICGCLGDQQAATLGQRCRQGEAKSTFGTGCFVLLNTGPSLVHSTHGLISTVAFQLGPTAAITYALEGSVAIAGAGVAWLKDNLGIISSAREVEALARSVPDTAGVCLVPAFGGLFAPHWRDDARAAIFGLTQYSTRAHIARAMLEAICFQTREVLDAMHADAAACKLRMSLLALRVDGGASSNDLLMQLQADILGASVVRPADVETTALGAALAAGVTLDLWSGEAVFSQHQLRKGATEFSPAGSDGERCARYARWKSAVGRSLGWTRDPPPIPVYAQTSADQSDATALLHARAASWMHVAGTLAVGAALGALLAARVHEYRARA